MIRRTAFDQVVRRLSNQGYKILLDILLSARPALRVEEVPYTFRTRRSGESKLDLIAVLDYLALLTDKTIGHVLPLRFIMFVSVGTVGLFVHLSVLAMLNRGIGVAFAAANVAAAMTAMTFNFFLNNLLTYRDMRLKGFWPIVRGLVKASRRCALLAPRVTSASPWCCFSAITLGGWRLVAGIFMGAVWNYTATSIFTLAQRSRSRAAGTARSGIAGEFSRAGAPIRAAKSRGVVSRQCATMADASFALRLDKNARIHSRCNASFQPLFPTRNRLNLSCVFIQSTVSIWYFSSTVSQAASLTCDWPSLK